MSRRKWLIVLFALFIILVCIVGAVLTNGYIWSFREMTYRRLLRSLPEPSGWKPETDILDTSAYSPLGFRNFDVNGQYGEVIEFYKSEFPLTDWHILMYEEDTITPKNEYYILETRIDLSYQERYCLRIFIGTRVNNLEVQMDERVWFYATIKEKEDASCSF